MWEAMAPGPPPAPLTRWQTSWRLVLVGLIGLGSWAMSWLEPDPRLLSDPRMLLAGVDLLAFLPSLWLVQRRRQHPVLVAVILLGATALFASVSGAALLAMFSLAARRHLQALILALPLSVGASLFFSRVLHPIEAPPHIVGEIFSTSLIAVVFVATGYAIGARRAVKQAAQERLEAAEREQEARVAQAKASERTRIAREMHDVLAHRISLVTMHASALNYRDDLSDDERKTAAATIDRNAREALTELREVLGVLRDPMQVSVDTDPERPQPTLRDLGALVAEARTLGASIEVTDESGEVPERVGRTAYRIVQEALTNARKHAPGQPITVVVRGGGAEDLTVVVSHPLADATHTPPPGSGLGLLGLRERVELVGGVLEAGQTEGRWDVGARIPLAP